MHWHIAAAGAAEHSQQQWLGWTAAELQLLLLLQQYTRGEASQ
jgi:hypothetical protein